MTRRLLLPLITALLAGAAPAGNLATLDEATYPKLITEQKGHVTLVNFWATYCVPCRAEMPQLVKLQEKLKAKGFRLITVSADEIEQASQAAQVLQKNAVPAPAYRKQAKDDNKFINNIDPKWSGELPASFLYDKTGRKVRSFFGEVKIAEVEAAITKLL